MYLCKFMNLRSYKLLFHCLPIDSQLCIFKSTLLMNISKEYFFNKTCHSKRSKIMVYVSMFRDVYLFVYIYINRTCVFRILFITINSCIMPLQNIPYAEACEAIKYSNRPRRSMRRTIKQKDCASFCLFGRISMRRDTFVLFSELIYKLVIQIGRQETRRGNKPILSDTNWKRLNKS